MTRLSPRALPLTLLCALACAATSGCVTAPDLVIVDRKTALEEQASGSFRGLEDELEQAGITPRPAPYTRAQLAEGGVTGTGLGGPGSEAADQAAGDAAQIDQLLIRRCAGEALDGTLVETLVTCTGSADAARIGHLLERENRNRRQAWTYLATKRPRASPAEIRRAWREVHLRGVVCDGQVQRDDGSWEAKRC